MATTTGFRPGGAKDRQVRCRRASRTREIFAIFETEHGDFPAKILEVNADGSYVVQWYNCASGKATAKGAYKPSWYDANSNSEIFDEKEHAMPTWNIQNRHTVVIGPFNWNVNKSGRFLPAEVALKMFKKGK